MNADTPISSLPLGRNLEKALKILEINIARDLLTMKVESVRSLPRIGKITMEELRQIRKELVNNICHCLSELSGENTLNWDSIRAQLSPQYVGRLQNMGVNSLERFLLLDWADIHNEFKGWIGGDDADLTDDQSFTTIFCIDEDGGVRILNENGQEIPVVEEKLIEPWEERTKDGKACWAEVLVLKELICERTKIVS